mmetsp:Transcript_57358/g.171064  ORF Transcript_57358/g.171064 Transcript_57358/m.171064 type:complete len:303 (-) Transcript_57358:956-1864(-)
MAGLTSLALLLLMLPVHHLVRSRYRIQQPPVLLIEHRGPPLQILDVIAHPHQRRVLVGLARGVCRLQHRAEFPDLFRNLVGPLLLAEVAGLPTALLVGLVLGYHEGGGVAAAGGDVRWGGKGGEVCESSGRRGGRGACGRGGRRGTRRSREGKGCVWKDGRLCLGLRLRRLSSLGGAEHCGTGWVGHWRRRCVGVRLRNLQNLILTLILMLLSLRLDHLRLNLNMSLGLSLNLLLCDLNVLRLGLLGLNLIRQKGGRCGWWGHDCHGHTRRRGDHTRGNCRATNGTRRRRNDRPEHPRRYYG